MHGELMARTDRELRVRYLADTASVPSARRHVADVLESWGRSDLVDDAMLCASELAGNATLHSGCTHLEISVVALDDGVRLVVEDDGDVPVTAVTPRTTLPGLDQAFDDELDELDLLLADQPATGRGLAIVSVLARAWGVEELAGGKRVWAELAADPEAEHLGTAPRPAPDPSDDELPAGWVTVRLPGCPAALVRRHDQHLDELVRELKLMLSTADHPESVVTATRLQPVVDASVFVRLSVRRQAEQALAGGTSHVDVEVSVPAGFSQDMRQLDDALREADLLSEERRLLTLPASADIRALRAWMSAQVVGQVERGARPASWKTWQSQRIERT